ncbi:MAG: hypothetical protein RR646_04015 [Erysipelotrichaceae bacterium]
MLNKYKIYFKEYITRFTRKQKNIFINQLNKEFKPYNIEPSMLVTKKFIRTSNNIVYGNLKLAKLIVMVPYDTPQLILYPNYLYYPLDGSKNQNKTVLATYIPAMILYTLLLAALTFLPTIFTSIQAQLVLVVISSIVFIALMKSIIIGFSNKHNTNRNTASIIASLELLKSLNKDNLKKIAFVYTDQNTNKHLGAESLATELKNLNRNPAIINLNCISTGNNLLIGCIHDSEKLAKELLNCYHGTTDIKRISLSSSMSMLTPLMYFKNIISISAGELDKDNNLYVKNTSSKKDNVMDEQLLQSVIDMIREYINAKKDY